MPPQMTKALKPPQMLKLWKGESEPKFYPSRILISTPAPFKKLGMTFNILFYQFLKKI